MTQCKIYYTGSNLQVNQTTGVKTVQHDQTEFELMPGWQLVQITSAESFQIAFMEIAGENIQTCMNTAYASTSEIGYRQPCSEIKPGEIYNIWLHSDPSVLKERILSQLSFANTNQDLSLTHNCYFNLGRAVDAKYGHMSHYMARAEGPNYYPQSYYKCPYTVLDLECDAEQMLADIQDYDFSWKKRTNPGPWSSERIFDPDNRTSFCSLNKLPFPRVKQWLQDNGIYNIDLMNINLIRPGAKFDMHLDADPFPDSQVLYVPLHNNPDSFIKVSGAGIMPYDRICLLNNRDFVHGSVAANDQDRYVLLFICNYDPEWVNAHRVPGPYFS